MSMVKRCLVDRILDHAPVDRGRACVAEWQQAGYRVDMGDNGIRIDRGSDLRRSPGHARPDMARRVGTHARGFLRHYANDILALHDGSLREIRSASGIISFPSYHVVLTLLVVYALRGSRLFWPAVVLAWLTLLSVPSVGMHYLVDIPGGAAVVAITVRLVHHFRAGGCRNAISGRGAAIVSADIARGNHQRRQSSRFCRATRA